MVILLFVLLLVSLYGIRFSSFHNDYNCLDSTNAIKGIFAVLVLYSHMRQYLNLTDTFVNNSYLAIMRYIGQMMVTMYLFYSGYGLMESQRKKPDYKKLFPKNRLLKILLHFDFAVLLYIILQFIMGRQYSLLEYMGSLVGWYSVGNSNWFIFVILALYALFYISLCIEKWSNKRNNENPNREGIIPVTIFVSCAFLWLWLYYAKGQSWWLNNILVFPLGICFSMYQNQIDEWIRKGKNYWYAFLSLTIIIASWHKYVGIDKIGVITCIFGLWTVLLTMKVKFNNKILQWLGALAFSIYILQRLPMILLTYFGVNQNALLFVMIVIPSVLIIAHLYNRILNRIDQFFFPPKIIDNSTQK